MQVQETFNAEIMECKLVQKSGYYTCTLTEEDLESGIVNDLRGIRITTLKLPFVYKTKFFELGIIKFFEKYDISKLIAVFFVGNRLSIGFNVKFYGEKEFYNGSNIKMK